VDLDSSIRLSKAINGEMPSRLEYKKPKWSEGQVVRTSGLVEDTCKHGVGHPNKDFLKGKKSQNEIHGCDGCCNDQFVDANKMVDNRTEEEQMCEIMQERGISLEDIE
jgi:hypothetical protein